MRLSDLVSTTVHQIEGHSIHSLRLPTFFKVTPKEYRYPKSRSVRRDGKKVYWNPGLRHRVEENDFTG